LLARHCSHRGTSLEYGVIEDRGIRCCYHGWHYDVDGRILETPGEPPDSPIRHKLCHGAYPVKEHGGLVFAFMGPPDKMAPFPLYDTLHIPGLRLGRGELHGVDNVKPCNWLQVMDNVVDPVHEAFLHSRISGYQFLDKNGRPVAELGDVPETAYVETPIGIACQVTRRVGGDVWVRNIEYICPNIAQIARTPAFPPEYKNGEEELWQIPMITRWRVPVDDTATVEYALVRIGSGQSNPYIDNPPPVLRANYSGRPYDEMQRTPGDYEAQVGQRPIAIHALEHLATTDRGVIMLRRMVREGIMAVQRGEDPKGVIRDGKTISTFGYEAVLRINPANNPEDDKQLLRDAAQRTLKSVLERPLVRRGEMTI